MKNFTNTEQENTTMKHMNKRHYLNKEQKKAEHQKRKQRQNARGRGWASL